MTKNSIVKCEKGLTLIEVLASLVILGIVFIGFMNIFPQMTVFNKKTEIKLDTMNLARQEIVDIKSISPLSLPFSLDQLDSLKDEISGSPLNKLDDNDEIFKFEYEKKGYKYVVVFEKANVLESSELEDKVDNIALYKVHLQMFTDGGQMSSETYGYLEILDNEVVSGS